MIYEECTTVHDGQLPPMPAVPVFRSLMAVLFILVHNGHGDGRECVGYALSGYADRSSDLQWNDEVRRLSSSVCSSLMILARHTMLLI